MWLLTTRTVAYLSLVTSSARPAPLNPEPRRFLTESAGHAHVFARRAEVVDKAGLHSSTLALPSGAAAFRRCVGTLDGGSCRFHGKADGLPRSATVRGKSDDEDLRQVAPRTMLGSYPHIILNSYKNLSSDADVKATIAAAKASGQTMIGMYVDECYYFSFLRPLLEAAQGEGVSIFGMLRSHNGQIYCQEIYGNSTWNESAAPASGKEVDWSRVSTTLAHLAREFPHFVGYTIDDFYCMMEDPNTPPDQFGTTPPLSVASMAKAHSAMKSIAPASFFPDPHSQNYDQSSFRLERKFCAICLEILEQPLQLE